MIGSKRNAKRSWTHGRTSWSLRSEMKASIKVNKRRLNRLARRAYLFNSKGCGYKRLAGDCAYDRVT